MIDTPHQVQTMPFPHRLFLALRRLVLLALSLGLLAPAAWGAVSMSERYQQLKSGQQATLPGTTIGLVSTEQKELLSAEVTSLLPYSYESATAALLDTANWCQFMPLHFNIKACTHEKLPDGEQLTLYSGRKGYQTPQESHPLIYRVEDRQQTGSAFKLRLHANNGPAGTSNYLIEVEALDVPEGVLMHIRSSYRPSLSSNLLTRTYLSTLGRGKVGFTLDNESGDGRYVEGVRALIERNVMRYQLAVESYLATQTLPLKERREAVLTHWFRQNESYPKQLHEMDEVEYLAIKRREWRNQLQLQQALNDKLRLVSR